MEFTCQRQLWKVISFCPQHFCKMSYVNTIYSYSTNKTLCNMAQSEVYICVPSWPGLWRWNSSTSTSPAHIWQNRFTQIYISNPFSNIELNPFVSCVWQMRGLFLLYTAILALFSFNNWQQPAFYLQLYWFLQNGALAKRHFHLKLFGLEYQVQIV